VKVHVHRERPIAWSKQRQAVRYRSLVPLLALEWVGQWVAFRLSNWSFLEVLDQLGSFSILIAGILFFSESSDRLKQKHYQAWQVINGAQGRGGSGGRVEALQELNADRVPLIGIDVSGAFLQGVRLERARLVRSDFHGADAREADFQAAEFADANLVGANLRRSRCHKASFRGAALDDADFVGADLSEADLGGATLVAADLSYANLDAIAWQDIQSLKGVNIFGVRNAPREFVSWALQNGAVQIESDFQGQGVWFLETTLVCGRQGWSVAMGSDSEQWVDPIVLREANQF